MNKYKEAKINLKTLIDTRKDWTTKEIIIDQGDMDSILVAISAIEKQIPKKRTRKLQHQVCPACEYVYRYNTRCCPDCGQRLED